MQLKRLQVRDFRNLADVDIAFGPRFTVLHGHNGAGKTNVLEALYLVSTLRSFRSNDMGTLVRHEQGGARVDVTGSIPGLGVDSSLRVVLTRGTRSTRRTASADGKTVRSGADFYGRLPAILFTPEDLGVLRGSPGGRRRFLDRVLFAREKTHIVDVQTYEKLIRSRNQVLRSYQDADGTTKKKSTTRTPIPANARDRDHMLDAYEIRLAEVGGRIWERRTQLIETLRPRFADVFAQIHGVTPVADIRYVPRVQGQDLNLPELPVAPGGQSPGATLRASVLHAALQQRRRLDLIRGVTSVGPHRDDIEMTLGQQSAAKYASQGQSRALVLAFKIAELQASSAAFGRPPILLLDDVSSELDPTRTGQLFEALGREVQQCVLTTTSPRYIPIPEGIGRAYFEVDGGVVTPREAPARGP